MPSPLFGELSRTRPVVRGRPTCLMIRSLLVRSVRRVPSPARHHTTALPSAPIHFWRIMSRLTDSSRISLMNFQMILDRHESSFSCMNAKPANRRSRDMKGPRSSPASWRPRIVSSNRRITPDFLAQSHSSCPITSDGKEVFPDDVFPQSTLM